MLKLPLVLVEQTKQINRWTKRKQNFNAIKLINVYRRAVVGLVEEKDGNKMNFDNSSLMESTIKVVGR